VPAAAFAANDFHVALIRRGLPWVQSVLTTAGGAAVTVNRRSATRHAVAIAAMVRVSGQTLESTLETTPEATTIVNLSLSGALLAIGRRLSIGTLLSVRFQIPTHDHPIEAAAVVRWTSIEGAGIQFDGLRAGEVWSLGKYFERL
jgi:hypothetical protein